MMTALYCLVCIQKDNNKVMTTGVNCHVTATMTALCVGRGWAVGGEGGDSRDNNNVMMTGMNRHNIDDNNDSITLPCLRR